jgi:HK97 family phage portal protein
MGVTQTLRESIRRVRLAARAISKGETTTFTYKLSDPRLQKIFARSDDVELTDPYSQLAVFYACVNAKASNLAQVPWVITKRGSDAVVESGSIVDLFAHPNPATSRFQLWEAIIISLENRGEWHVVKDREVGTDGVPAFLWVKNPSVMTPARVGQGGPWVGWWLTQNGKREFLSNEEVIFDKYLNPNDDIRGLSPFTAARLSGMSAYDAQRYNRNFFKNDATPSLAYKFADPLTDEQYETEKLRLIESRKGVANSHRAAILDGGADIVQLGLTQRDMEFVGTIKMSRDEICMITRTPKSMIAINEDVNYANALASRRSFWMEILMPLGIRIEDKFNSSLLHPLGYEGHFDWQQVDAIASAWLDKIGSAVQLVNIGFTINQVNDRLQLGFEPVEWGNEPRQVTPIALPGPAPVKELATIPVRAPRLIPSDAAEKAARARAWTEISGTSSSIVAKCSREIRGYFASAEAKLFRKLVKSPPAPVFKVGQLLDPSSLSDIFSDEELAQIIVKWASQAMETGAGTITGSTLDVTDPQVIAAAHAHASKVVEINETVRQKLQETIRQTTEQAIADGLTEQQTADLLVANVKARLGEFDRHARTIARTEVHGAYSEGRYEGMKTTFPKGKQWISSRDARVRDSHAHLDGRVVPFDAEFDNGLRYPLDSAGDASEVINCRCVMVPVYEGDNR